MVEFFINEEMCDTCKKVKPLDEISQMQGNLYMCEGICMIDPVAAKCKECEKNE